MSILRFWLENARKIALPQSILPCLTAVVLCIRQNGFVWWLMFPILLGVGAVHLGMNLADDYFDYKHDPRLRSDLCSDSIRARMEKCMYLRSGQTTLHSLVLAMVCFLLFGAAMCCIVCVVQGFLCGWQAVIGIVSYAVLGLFIGLNYSGKPLELCFRGWGEVVIGLLFGPLLMLGTQAAMTGTFFSLPMLCMGVAVGCIVANIVYVHSVMEVNADAALGKMTFARLLGQTNRMIFFVAVFALLPFVILLIGVTLEWWSAWYMLTLLTLPMSLYLIYSTYRFAHNLPCKDTPRWWMGPMGNWNQFVEAGIDWFLIRWLLARNICIYFCLTLMLVHIVLLFLCV